MQMLRIDYYELRMSTNLRMNSADAIY